MAELSENNSLIEYLNGLCLLVQSFTGLKYFTVDINGEQYDNEHKTDEEFKNICKSAFSHTAAGESVHTFTCRNGVSYMILPIKPDEDILCGVAVGPFFITDTLKRDLPRAYGRNKLFAASKTIPAITGKRAQEIEKLTNAVFSDIIGDRSFANGSAYMRARLTEALRIYKDLPQKIDLSQYHTKETKLLSSIRNGTKLSVIESITDMSAYLVHLHGRDKKYIKCRYVELISLMSRAALMTGTKPETVFALNASFLKQLAMENDLDKMSFILRESAEAFHAVSFSDRDKGNPYIRAALQYIGENYGKKITLNDVSAGVNLSPNYFCALFRDTVGMNFSDYLCRLRVEESKLLLASREYSLSDIAIAMGFPDQSYFCKKFKKYTGITPGQYHI